MTHLHPTAQKGFSSSALLYQQVRPSYPQEMINWLRNQLKLAQSSVVIDLRAGTGKFLPFLQQVTSHITAIEPIHEMLKQLQSAYPQIVTVQTTSEQLPFPDSILDAVLCAQSFHWFANLACLNEIFRVLKPNAALGLIWNQRDTQIDWVNAIAQLIAPFEGDTPRYHHDNWKQVFQKQDLFKLEKLTTFPHFHVGTVENVVSNRLLSSSFIAALPANEQQQLKTKIEYIVWQYTGKQASDEIAFPYITYAYHFRKMP